MSTVTFKGEAVPVSGEFPTSGCIAPAFTLTAGDLSDYTLDTDSGKTLVLNIFPSLDTPVCAQSVRTFNADAASLDNVKVLCVSADLPFAMGRFCETEGIQDVISLSTFRSESFGGDYGVEIADGPLAKLLTRAVIVLSPERQVVYSQLVSEITDEPDYAAALQAAQA